MPFAERRGLLHRLAWFKDRPAARRAIVAIDLVGVAYGFLYYAQYDQFALTPALLWPFVPDSPLAVLWALLALLALERDRRAPALDALAFVGNVQVGLWTAYVLTRHADAFRTFDGVTLNGILLVAHLGMAAHALVFAHDLRNDWAAHRRAWLGVPLAYYVVNDVLDYFWTGVVYPENAGCPGIRPITIPCANDDVLLAAVTFALTLGSVALLWALARTRARSELAT